MIGEEDLVVSEDVLEFQSWAKREFQGRSEVFGVMSQMQGAFETDDPSAVALVQDFNPWVWGTWKDRRAPVLRYTWDKDYSSGGAADSGWDWNIAKRILPSRGGFMAVPGHHGVRTSVSTWGCMHPEAFDGTQAKTFRSMRPRCEYGLVNADNR